MSKSFLQLQIIFPILKWPLPFLSLSPIENKSAKMSLQYLLYRFCGYFKLKSTTLCIKSHLRAFLLSCRVNYCCSNIQRKQNQSSAFHRNASNSIIYKPVKCRLKVFILDLRFFKNRHKLCLLRNLVSCSPAFPSLLFPNLIDLL